MRPASAHRTAVFYGTSPISQPPSQAEPRYAAKCNGHDCHQHPGVEIITERPAEAAAHNRHIAQE